MRCVLRIYIGKGEAVYRSFRSIRAVKRFVPKIVYTISCPASVDLYVHNRYNGESIAHWELD